jgi:hypothetical protein
MLERSISYTLSSFGRHFSPTTQIYGYMQAAIQTLSTYAGELMLPCGVHETCPYPLHMVKCLGKQHELGGVKIVTTILREERVRSLVAGMGERVHRCIQSCLARVRSSLDCKGTVN